jgi:hypothetical protein
MNFNTILSIKIIMKKVHKKRILVEPKKPRNAYQYFCIVISQEFRITRNGAKTKRGEVLKEIAEIWKQFKLNPKPSSVLKRIRLEAENDKVRYQREINEWNSLDDMKNRKILEEKFILEEYDRKIRFIQDVNKLFDKNIEKERQTDLLDFIIILT